MSGPRKRSKKIDKVVSSVDVAYLNSIAEMDIYGVSYSTERLSLLAYQYRLDISAEFPAVAAVPIAWPVQRWYGGPAVLGTTNQSLDCTYTLDHCRIERVPEYLAKAGYDMASIAAGMFPDNSVKPRTLVLTIQSLVCNKADIPALLDLYGEPQERPVTYDITTNQLVNYNPQPAKEKK